ncbi:MAG: hypothetical protein M1816_001810 [Peltula sp. TS41687]|nr:MAG: hypothetical protein M1816_001810 [Peltula sp. TS41687]
MPTINGVKYACDAPSPTIAARAHNDPKAAHASTSTNSSTSAHRVRKHSRRESSGISESLLRAINNIDPKELKELQNLRSQPQKDDGANGGSNPSAARTPEGQDLEPSSQSVSSPQFPSGASYKSTTSTRSELSVTAQVDDLSSVSSVDTEIGAIDHLGGGPNNREIHRLENSRSARDANVGSPIGVNRQYSAAHARTYPGAQINSSAIQLQPAQPRKCCTHTCGPNTSQTTATSFDIPNPTYAGLSYNGNQAQTPSIEQQRARRPCSMNAFPAESPSQHNYSNMPITTNRYAIPQTSSAVPQPFTPEELAFLRRNPGFISRAVSHLASGAMSSANLSNPYNSTTHNCTCGDTCNCLGCISHPYNTKTLNFVQSLQDLMTGEDQFEGQTSRRMSLQRHPVQDMVATMAPTMNIPVTGMPSPAPASPFAPVNTRYGLETISQPQDLTGLATNGEVQDQFPLSPTAFYHVDYPIRSCSVGENNCFCGNGCACPGCSVHSRNGGIGSGQTSNNTSPELDAVLGTIPWSDQHQLQLFSMPVTGA